MSASTGDTDNTEYNEDTPGRGSGTWPRSVAVIGAAGLVGSGVVHQLALRGVGSTVWMVDVKENVARAHAIDIAEAQTLAGRDAPTVGLLSPEDVAKVAPVDLVVLAASAPEVPGGDRRAFLDANLDLLTNLAPTVRDLAGPTGAVVVLSNPIDVVAECLRQMTGLAGENIVGYSLNDSVRFQRAVAHELGIASQRVTAEVLGEHGTGQVPLFSQVRVDEARIALTDEQQERVRADVDGWFGRWSALKPGRSSGWTTALGAVRTIEMMAEGRVFPGATWTGGVDGMDDAYIALPIRFDGRARVAPWDCSEEERAAINAAARSVRATADDAMQLRSLS